MGNRTWTREELKMVRGVWEKDPSAQLRFAECFHKPLYEYIRNLLRDVHLAEDALQETIFAALAKPICPDWAPERYIAYLFGIAHNKALSTVRKERRWFGFADSSTVELVAKARDDPFASVCALDELFHVLEQLPIQCREVIHLSAVVGLVDEDIASLLHVAIGTVRSRKSRGLAQINRHLDENEERKAAATAGVAAPDGSLSPVPSATTDSVSQNVDPF